MSEKRENLKNDESRALDSTKYRISEYHFKTEAFAIDEEHVHCKLHYYIWQYLRSFMDVS